MIALTSHRPFNESDEVAQNQRRAHESWRNVFDEIIYWGEAEKELQTPETDFVPSEPFPLISTLAMAASLLDDFVCIINADILVTPNLRTVMGQVFSRGGRAVTSQRWQFNGKGIGYAKVTDWGADFFGATPQLWRQISKNVPRYYRIGHNCWDTWVMSFLNTVASDRFYNITKQRCIFHPIHQDRKRAYDVAPTEDKYTKHCGFPFKTL